jgi:hypothetical protein
VFTVRTDDSADQRSSSPCSPLNTRRAVLGATDVNGGSFQVELVKPQVNQFLNPQRAQYAMSTSNLSRAGLRLLPAAASSFSISASVSIPGCDR